MTNRLSHFSGQFFIVALCAVFSSQHNIAQTVSGAERSEPQEIIADAEKQLRDTITLWGRAWSDQRSDDFLSFYSSNYLPPGFANREDWIRNQKARIDGPEDLSVRLFSFEILEAGNAEAIVQFMLIYRRPEYSDRTLKELQLVKQGSYWKIHGERNISVEVLN